MFNKKSVYTVVLLALVTITLPVYANATTNIDPANEHKITINKDEDDKVSKDIQSNEKSSEAAVRIDSGKESVVGEKDSETVANTWERKITTPNKDIEISGSSNENSSNANSIGESEAAVDSAGAGSHE